MNMGDQRPSLLSDDEVWIEVGRAVRGLEAAWASHSFPDLSRWVLPPGHPHRRQVLVELVKVDQESRWTHGDRKTVEA